MALDKLTVQFFRSIELAPNGRTTIENMVRGIPGPGASSDPKAVLKLAKIAEEYLLQYHRLVVVMSKKQILHRQRMERYVRQCNEREAQGKAAVPPPSTIPPLPPSNPFKSDKQILEYRKKLEEVRRKDAERVANPPPPPPKPKSPSQYVHVMLDGQRIRVHVDLLDLLKGKVKFDG